MTLIVTAHDADDAGGHREPSRAAYIEMARLKRGCAARKRVIAVRRAPPWPPSRQRHRAEPGLPDRRRGAGRRGGLRLPRSWPTSGRQRGQARFPRRASRLPDLCRHLHPAQPCGRPDRDPVEPRLLHPRWPMPWLTLRSAVHPVSASTLHHPGLCAGRGFAPGLPRSPRPMPSAHQYAPWAAPHYLRTDALGRDVHVADDLETPQHGGHPRWSCRWPSFWARQPG